MHFQSKYLYVLNQLVWRLLIPGNIPMIKNKINNNKILMDSQPFSLVSNGQRVKHAIY
jgi:hypothetical protein